MTSRGQVNCLSQFLSILAPSIAIPCKESNQVWKVYGDGGSPPPPGNLFSSLLSF